ncbi:MAG TPA: acetolactate synthase [Acidimicrobiales bacterium]|nr:acetolactate synthase [Acidimicrobiales bacterium]
MAEAPGGSELEGHGGELALAGLGGPDVGTVFTLSGGHVFPVYDACVKAGVSILDVRHEQTAAFAAEGVAKLTRGPGVAVLTAGPGVTNGMSAITTARFNGSPLVVLAGRAPRARWGSGSLQELDHVPMVAPVTKVATTVAQTADIPATVAGAVRAALTPHRGPAFVDIPLDVLFGTARASLPAGGGGTGGDPDPDEVRRAGQLLAAAERPALVAGSDVWWNGAWESLRRCAEALRVPTFANGLGRGCLPADHELAAGWARGLLREADVVAVVGAPLDFRLSFGQLGQARIVHVVDSPDARASHVDLAASPAGDLAAVLDAMAETTGARSDHEAWIARLVDEDRSRRKAAEAELTADTTPVHPARVYGELRSRLDRDAVVIGDGGDFVSWAGRLVDSYQPGCWMDPGPYGCLGTGLGYAIAARTIHPDRQVVLLAGDGALGFSAMDIDSLVRHRLPVAIVVGNNGIWGLEKHPMRALYGYDVAADLQPGCRYDDVVRALGGAGETVSRPEEVGPALDRALAAGAPYLVNVLTDPEVAYPRSSNLA